MKSDRGYPNDSYNNVKPFQVFHVLVVEDAVLLLIPVRACRTMHPPFSTNCPFRRIGRLRSRCMLDYRTRDRKLVFWLLAIWGGFREKGFQD